MGKEKKGSQGGKPRPQGCIDGSPFHSAVNRIPVPREKILREVKQGTLPAVLFGDSASLGHDHLPAECWSGTVKLVMTVQTPLVYGQQHYLNKREGVKYVELPVNGDEIYLPATMVKGMISRAYETLTASRFRVFGEHSRPLTYRSTSDEASWLVGAQVEKEGENLIIRLPQDPTKETRLLLIEDDPTGGPRRKQKIEKLRERLRHGERVSVGVRGSKCVLEGADVPGVVFRTATDGAYSPELFGPEEDSSDASKQIRKKYERLVKDLEGGQPQTRELDEEEHIKPYLRILQAYVDEFKRRQREGEDLQSERLKKLNRAAFEHMKDPKRGLKPGDMVFVAPAGPQGEPFKRFEIVPTMVGRRAYRSSPRALAEVQRVLPLKDPSESSAADRMFGYVIGTSEDETAAAIAPEYGRSLRGRIEFGPVSVGFALEAARKQREVVLPPLLEPKPSAARRFLTDSTIQGMTPTVGGNPLRRQSLYTSGQFLGRAAYPVQRERFTQKFTTESLQPPYDGKLKQDNEEVCLRVKSWIPAGVRLECTLRFVNLMEDELRALLWVLTPENLCPEENASQGSVGFLRMGIGKPYGLGAVEARVDEQSFTAVKGCDLANAYHELDFCLGAEDGRFSVSDFRFSEQMEADLRGRSWVKAFQRAAYGYDREHRRVPVRYMSIEEEQANNRVNRETRNPLAGCGVFPEDLAETPSPIRIPMPKRK